MRDLRVEYPDDELFFITGADALEQILTWRDANELFTLAHFIGVTRPGYQLDNHHLPEGKVSLVEVTAMAISSTGCRERVRTGSPCGTSCPTAWCATSTREVVRSRSS